MAAVRRACMWLGIGATFSLVLSLSVMMFLYEAPQVATWFSASVTLAAVSFVSAVIAHHFER